MVDSARPHTSLSIVKLGGSVLTGLPAFEAAAGFLAREILTNSRRRIVAVVSAELGHTDDLAREAEALSTEPDADALDLLWSTGELRSVALLTLALRHAGVRAEALNAHEAGLRAGPDIEHFDFNPIRLHTALVAHSVVVVPGFLATRHQRLVTLGRGGSDLTAVLLAAALQADECVLVKDVDGYFTADPATTPDARPIPELTLDEAIAMADEGCPLVQRQALAAARRARMTVVVRSADGTGTRVNDDIDDDNNDRQNVSDAKRANPRERSGAMGSPRESA